MEQRTFAQLLVVLRKARGMTQQQLADKLVVSNKTISKWENGDSTPDIAILPVIAEVFEVTCDELLSGKINNFEDKEEGIDGSKLSKKAVSRVVKANFNETINKCSLLTIISLPFSIVATILVLINHIASIIVGVCLLVGAVICIGLFFLQVNKFHQSVSTLDLDSYEMNIMAENRKFYNRAFLMIAFAVVSLLLSTWSMVYWASVVGGLL